MEDGGGLREGGGEGVVARSASDLAFSQHHTTFNLCVPSLEVG